MPRLVASLEGAWVIMALVSRAIGNESRLMSRTRSPWWLNENIAAAKSFMLGERVRLRLQVQFFNALNRVVFCSPITNLNDPNFGG